MEEEKFHNFKRNLNAYNKYSANMTHEEKKWLLNYADATIYELHHLMQVNLKTHPNYLSLEKMWYDENLLQNGRIDDVDYKMT